MHPAQEGDNTDD
ncbi:hypothetical protein SS209_00502 [Salmonella enterica subsp. enterica serovar Senftenberg str. SS209]|nr:hypothetical protein SS209_00502 [Salmonella enterica subsp. enterica serovar Senftenberg str. SS209]